jgi:hypothetical protein
MAINEFGTGGKLPAFPQKRQENSVIISSRNQKQFLKHPGTNHSF